MQNSTRNYNLSVVDFRGETAKHTVFEFGLPFDTMATILGDLFVDWDTAFEQFHEATIGALHNKGELHHTSFYLKSVGIEDVHYCDVDNDIICFDKQVRSLDMVVTKHKVVLTPKMDATAEFRIVITAS